MVTRSFGVTTRRISLGVGVGLLSLLSLATRTPPRAAQAQGPARPGAPPLTAAQERGLAPGPDARPAPRYKDAANPLTIVQGPFTNLFPDLRRVSAASATEAWAIGIQPGALLHYNGNAWTIPIVFPGVILEDIQMTGPTDGWLTGFDTATGHNKTYRYDGAHWAEFYAIGGYKVEQLSAISESDVWATGVYCLSKFNCVGVLQHWNGAAWQYADGPSVEKYSDIAMRTATDGWAIGEGLNNEPEVFHYDGVSWSPAPAPPTATSLARVAATEGEVWATGIGSAYDSGLFRYSGGAWTEIATPGAAPQSVYMVTAGDGWVATDSGLLHWDGAQLTADYSGRALVDIAAAPDQVWAVGHAETVVSKTGAGPWALQRGGPTTADLFTVSTVSVDEAWAAGGRGAFAHYLNGQWQEVATPFTTTVWSLRMVSAREGYAVGDDFIARWDGAAWSRVASPGGALYALDMVGPGEGWAVGNRGRIWHETGGVWSEARPPGFGLTLLGVTMDSPEHGWAVGSLTSVVLLEYTGGHWLDRTTTLPPGTRGLQGIITSNGGADVWAGVAANFEQADPALLHRTSDGTWHWVTDVTGSGLLRFAPEALGEIWGVGQPITHYAGETWHSMSIPAPIGPFQDISLIPGRGGWIVGYYGQIVAYNPLAPGQRYYDVPLNNPFATYIEYMAAHNIISGYGDNTFHPYSNITRGQLSKMVVAGMGWSPAAPATATFADVPPGSAFYGFVEAAVGRGVISGYTCGGVGEPCDLAHRPYFRPNNDVTRAQLAKIIVGAKGWTPLSPARPTFADVPRSNPFYGVIEQAAAKGVISGYACGAAGEPCDAANRPYFRWPSSATRGQLSKILNLALNQP